MSIIYKYINVKRSDGTLKKAPFIEVYLRDKNNKLIKNIALIDSGADMTVVPKDLARFLGLKETPHEELTGGIGGEVRVKRTKISFQLKGEHESHSLTVDALVLQDENSDMPLLLGRNGIFEKFHITFKQNQGKIIFTKTEN